MTYIKNFQEFQEFKDAVNNNPELQKELKDNPLETLNNITVSGPVYTSDKFVYRIVVGGFIAILFLGILFYIFQFQHTLSARIEFSKQILDACKNLSGSGDSLAAEKLKAIQVSLLGPGGIKGETPDGIVAVFTAIIGVLAGLFAPSPFSKQK